MISEAIKALKAGEELKNAETWKNVQATAGAVSAVFGAIIMVLGWAGVHLNVTNEELTYIAGGVAGVLGVFNGYTTLATSKRVGVPVSSGDKSSNAAPDPGEIS